MLEDHPRQLVLDGQDLEHLWSVENPVLVFLTTGSRAC